MRFTNADYRDWVGGIYRGGYGCAGFVFELSDAAYRKAYNVPAGTLPPMAKMRTTNMTDLRPGDIIRLDYNTHSVIVLRVAKSYVEVAEANYNKSVHWGRIITFAEILQTGTNIITRYDDSYQVSVGTQALEAYQTFMKARASLPALSDPRS